MICREIYDSYEFLALLNDTDCRLYTYLCLYADDNGVVEALRVMRIIQSPQASLEKLVKLGFVKLLNDQDKLHITDLQHVWSQKAGDVPAEYDNCKRECVHRRERMF